jgi:hypothetical protein
MGASLDGTDRGLPVAVRCARRARPGQGGKAGQQLELVLIFARSHRALPAKVDRDGTPQVRTWRVARDDVATVLSPSTSRRSTQRGLLAGVGNLARQECPGRPQLANGVTDFSGSVVGPINGVAQLGEVVRPPAGEGQP